MSRSQIYIFGTLVCAIVAVTLYLTLKFRNWPFSELENRINSVGQANLSMWATNLLQENTMALQKTNRVQISISQVPYWISEIGDPFPLYACVLWADQSEVGHCVHIAWLSGRGGAALLIGSPSFTYTNFNREEFDVRIVAPGIYTSILRK